MLCFLWKKARKQLRIEGFSMRSVWNNVEDGACYGKTGDLRRGFTEESCHSSALTLRLPQLWLKTQSRRERIKVIYIMRVRTSNYQYRSEKVLVYKRQEQPDIYNKYWDTCVHILCLNKTLDQMRNTQLPQRAPGPSSLGPHRRSSWPMQRNSMRNRV